MERITHAIAKGAGWGIGAGLGAGLSKTVFDSMPVAEQGGDLGLIREWMQDTDMFTLMAEVAAASAVLGFLAGMAFPPKK